MKLLFGITFLTIAFFFTHIGMRVLLSKRPYLFPARRSFIMVVLAFLPAMIHEAKTFWNGGHGGEGGGPLLLQFTLLLGLLWFMWTQLRGYTIVGITRTSLHEALDLTLKRLDLVYQQKGPLLFLPSRKLALHVNVWSWFGTGQLRITPRSGAPLLREIARGIGDNFDLEKSRVNLISAAVYVWAGILNAAVVILFFWL